VTLAILAAAALAVVGGPLAGPTGAREGPTKPGTWRPGSVTRLAGADRVATAVAASAHGWDQADTVVLASAAGFADALAAGALAADRGGPLLLTWPAVLPSVVADELARLGPDEVVVVGGAGAIEPATAEAAADAAGADLERVAGATRWATAAAVAGEVGPSGGEVVLASGTDFADALAAGGLDGGHGPSPVLLTPSDALPAATKRALAALEADRVTVIGGKAAVSAGVAATAGDHARRVQRLAGPTRFDTSVAVLAEARSRAGGDLAVVVANGSGYADALAAGALAAALDGQVALSAPNRLPGVLDRWLRAHRGAAAERLLGGRAALSPRVRIELAAIADGAPRPRHTRTSPGGFTGVAGPLPGPTRRAMTGVTWEPGCPVGRDELALLEMDHVTFDGATTSGAHNSAEPTARGVMIAHRDVAAQLLAVFARLHDAGFPVERMRLLTDYGGDDDAAMADNNTSAFNCRTVTGGSSWSRHAYGTAVDINPIQNPYVNDGEVRPPAGDAYVDRADRRPGMIARPGPATAAFDARGWTWGGDWNSLKDWMHFQR